MKKKLYFTKSIWSFFPPLFMRLFRVNKNVIYFPSRDMDSDHPVSSIYSKN